MLTPPSSQRLDSSAGIAIGPILFVLAMLGALATAMSTSMTGFTTAGVTDRVSADIVSQANLIRVKINECNLLHGTYNNGDGWPASDPTNGTKVADLECIGDPAGRKNLWSGVRNVLLPPPTRGFNEWYYMNAGATGGRCIWTTPINPDAGGLDTAATKFSSQELKYNPSGGTQKFVLFITMPSGAVDANCAVP